MPSLAVTKAANAAQAAKLPFRPVALFVGGTSGIGKGSVQAFANHTSSSPSSPGAHILICGRNEAAAKQIIDSFPKHPQAKYEFVQCDMSKIENVEECCRKLKEERGLEKVNYLFMSPGFVSVFGGYNDTGEGIDRKLAVHFYSRFKFFTELAPMMEAAKAKGEEARVVSVLGAGHGKEADLSDLGLKKTYSVAKCGAQSTTYTSLVMEEFAKKHPSLSFTHIYPGWVDTPITDGDRLLKVVAPLLKVFATSIEDCGEWMLRPIFDPSMAKGAFHLDNHGDPYPASKLHLGEKAQKSVFEHLMETIWGK